MGFLCTLTLAACGSSKPADTVASLEANPDRLKEIMQQCHEDQQSELSNWKVPGVFHRTISLPATPSCSDVR
jgi:hypothetical protein